MARIGRPREPRGGACRICGTPVPPESRWSRHCSAACRAKATRCAGVERERAEDAEARYAQAAHHIAEAVRAVVNGDVAYVYAKSNLVLLVQRWEQARREIRGAAHAR